MEQLLINIDDIRVYRDIDPNYDTTRLNGFVRDVQRRNLRDFFGASMYYDFMQNITETKYVNLLNGITFIYEGETVEYLGLKPILVYWVLAKIIREGDMFISSYGTAEFINNPQEQFQSARHKEMIAQDHMSTAQDYVNETIRYIEANSSDFPLWDSKNESPGTKFTMFKV